MNLTMNGAGVQYLTGNNTFLGSTFVTGGTLVLAGSNAYAGGTTIGAAAGTGVVRAAATGALGTGPIQLDGTGNGSQARLELTGGIELDNPIGFPARNSNTVAIESLSGNNTLGGQLTLAVGGSNYWIQSDAGSQLNLTGGSLAGGTAITSTAAGTRTVTLLGHGNGLISGDITNGSATAINLVMSGSGTWTLSGTNSYSGETEVLNGTLVVTSPAQSSTAATCSSARPERSFRRSCLRRPLAARRPRRPSRRCPNRARWPCWRRYSAACSSGGGENDWFGKGNVPSRGRLIFDRLPRHDRSA